MQKPYQRKEPRLFAAILLKSPKLECQTVNYSDSRLIRGESEKKPPFPHQSAKAAAGE